MMKKDGRNQTMATTQEKTTAELSAYVRWLLENRRATLLDSKKKAAESIQATEKELQEITRTLGDMNP
jgi:hypothetical protein